MTRQKRILIVGAGSIGLKQLRAFDALDPRPALTVVDPREEARARAMELGAELLSAGWDEIDLLCFDGVVICAPAPAHVPYIARCLREGVAVLSEKPLSQSWEGVKELLDIAGQRDAPPSGVAYVRRYHPMHERALEIITSGEVGPMLAVRVNGGQHFPTYRPDYRQIYYASRAQGGGCVLDYASHFLDLVQWFLGPIKAISGFARHLALEGVDVEDAATLSFTFRDTARVGSLHINQFQPLNENTIELCGLGGVLRIIEPSFEGRIWRQSATQWEELQVEPADYTEALRRQAAAFVATIDGGPPMRTSLTDAAHTLRICLDFLKSTGLSVAS